MALDAYEEGTFLNYEDLPEEEQERLLKERMHIAQAIFDDLQQDILDNCREVLEHVGIAVDDIFYSGFWSQGDGACFTGTLTLEPTALEWVEKNYPTDSTLHANVEDILDCLAALPEEPAVYMTHHGHYYHYKSISFQWEYDTDDETLNRWIAEHSEDELSGLEESVQTSLRALMRWVYNVLESEYDWQTSEACALEYLHDQTYKVVVRKHLEEL
jgi:hypothetical protein